MLAEVTNRSRGARGFQTAAGTRFLDPGESAQLDLLDHPLHDAWAAAGEVAIRPVEPPKEPSGAPPRPPQKGRRPL